MLFSLNCPNCTAPVEWGQNSTQAQCVYCGSILKFEDFSSTKMANNSAGMLASELAIQRLSKEYADIQSKLNNYRASKKDQAQRRRKHYEEELAKFEMHVKQPWMMQSFNEIN